jgi:hypothetical protein
MSPVEGNTWEQYINDNARPPRNYLLLITNMKNNQREPNPNSKIHHLIERALISMISFNYKSKENGLGSNI